MNHRTALLATVILMMSPIAAAQTDYLLLPVTAFRNGTTSIGDMQLRTIESPVQSTAEHPDLRITADTDGTSYYEYSTNLTFVQFASRRGEYIVNNQTTEFVEIPVNRSDITVSIYRQGTRRYRLTDADITSAVCMHGDETCKSFCARRTADRDCTCGDGVCNFELENATTCPQDCDAPDTPNNDTANGDGESDGGGLPHIWLAVGIVLLLAGVVGYLSIQPG